MNTIKIKSLNNANVDLKSVIIPKEIVIGPEGTLDITENGTYDVETYKYADVDVPQPEGTIEITENGTGIDIAQYALANINVPSSEIKMGSFNPGTEVKNIYIEHNLGKEPSFFVIGMFYGSGSRYSTSGNTSYFYFNINGNIYSYRTYGAATRDGYLTLNPVSVSKVDTPTSIEQVYITDKVFELRTAHSWWYGTKGSYYMWFCG